MEESWRLIVDKQDKMITGPNLVSGHEYRLIPVPAPQAGGDRLFVSSRFLLQNILKQNGEFLSRLP